MPTHDKGKQSKPDNLPIAKRRLFERVLKGKGKVTQTENVSKKRKLEKVVKAREEKKDNSKKLKKMDKKQELEKQGTTNVKKERKSNKKVGVQRGADRREAGRMREGHMDASDFLSLPLWPESVFCKLTTTQNGKNWQKGSPIMNSTFHETKSREETNERFKKGECSQQAELSNKEVAEYFLKFPELIMINNQALNMKLDKLILEVEGLKDMLKEKERETVELNETIQRDENNENDGGEGHRNNGEEMGMRDKGEQDGKSGNESEGKNDQRDGNNETENEGQEVYYTDIYSCIFYFVTMYIIY
ncbi:uncharacterized protein E6C27_scaffold319G001240 [Cucumis melo var. makuwa]|uniref:Protein Ycf2-like n=1 Tax=Cucumis melo var. makuwa TaxID=1194695 RepID=A0A5A7UQS8_CUCMM|nr:uncharacterized protein E6C27_scaffold319G001240 [Cucumis melo var. makuwa]